MKLQKKHPVYMASPTRSGACTLDQGLEVEGQARALFLRPGPGRAPPALLEAGRCRGDTRQRSKTAGGAQDEHQTESQCPQRGKAWGEQKKEVEAGGGPPSPSPGSR